MLGLRTLGLLDLHKRDGPELRSVLAQPKRTALLCYLALARPRGFHHRDTLLSLFWPETDTEHARASLRQAVRFLRRSLGEGVVRSRGDEELGLGEGMLECDAVAFQEALAAGETERALALYGGELLPGFYVEGAPQFEAWLEAERAHLRDHAAAGAWSLANACEHAGDPIGAARWGQRALALAPADDAALRRLMQLLDRLGDPDGALVAYHAGARRLRLEYEIEPSPATRDLADEICERMRATTAAAASSGVAPGVAAGGGGRVEGTAASAPAAGIPPATGGVGFSWIASRATRGPRIGAILVAAAVVLLGAGAGAWLIPHRRAPAFEPRRLVIVPFENRTGDTALTALGDMAADWIAQGLSRAAIAEVADGSVARAIARQTAPEAGARSGELLRRLSRATGAGLVVTGRYYRDADSLALVAQVVDVRSGRLLRTVGPIGAARAAPAAGVVRLRERMLAELAMLLDERVPVRSPDFRPPSYEAYREFMEGVYRAEVLNEIGEAGDNYLRAYQLDTTFYRALVSASYAAMMHGPRARYDSLQPVLERVRDRLSPTERRGLEFQRAYRSFDYRAMYAMARNDAGRSALTDNSRFGLAVSAGRVHRYRESLAEMRRVDPARPMTPRLYWAYLGGAQHVLGDFRGQLRSAAAMARRSPESAVPDAMRLTAHSALGHTAEARRLALALAGRAARDTMFFQEVGNLEMLGVPPRTPAVTFFLAARELAAHGRAADARLLVDDGLRWCAARPPAEQADTTFRWVYAQLLGMAGHWREADAALPASSPPGWNPPLQWSRAIVAARLGDRARALEISRELGSSPKPMLEFHRISIAAALGDRAEVRRRLRELLASGGFFGEWWLHTEPDLAPYLADPELRHLLRADG